MLALDGLGRTHSAEAPAAAWRESLAALAALVAPGGRLVLGSATTWAWTGSSRHGLADRDGGDDQWEPHGFDPTYPDGPAALDAALESAGLEPGAMLFGLPGQPGAARAAVARGAGRMTCRRRWRSR